MANEIFPNDTPSDVPRPPAATPPSADGVAASRRKMARKRLLLIAAALAIAGLGYWYFESTSSLSLEKIASFENSVSNTLTQSVLPQLPAPLVGSSTAAKKNSNVLTIAGVIADTNVQRGDNGFSALTENATLDDIAALRLDDMFTKQYFAHVGPDGESAISVASSVGYTYLALGENLALGNFDGDDGVVAAWMASPGHRANILDLHYTQIGVAVRFGSYNGANTWIAVQVFGKPSADCPTVDPNLKASIDTSQNQLDTMAGELTQEKAAIDAMTPQYGDAYNEKVQEYNALAAQYNDLAAKTKTAIAQYNNEVQAFNACLGA